MNSSYLNRSKAILVLVKQMLHKCVYIKGLVNTKDQSNACMCEMMSKGSKEALTVLILSHATHVEGVERSLDSSNCYSCYSCQKGQKIML